MRCVVSFVTPNTTKQLPAVRTAGLGRSMPSRNLPSRANLLRRRRASEFGAILSHGSRLACASGPTEKDARLDRSISVSCLSHFRFGSARFYLRVTFCFLRTWPRVRVLTYGGFGGRRADLRSADGFADCPPSSRRRADRMVLCFVLRRSVRVDGISFGNVYVDYSAVPSCLARQPRRERVRPESPLSRGEPKAELRRLHENMR